MKNYYIYLVTILLLSSCRNGSIVDFEDSERNEAEIYKGAFYTGTIHSDGQAISDAVIKIYQNGKLLGETISDANGEYNTIAFDLAIGPEVTFEVLRENYYQKVKRNSSGEKIYKDFDLNLIPGTLLSLDSFLDFPGDTTLVKIFGTFTDALGNPIEGAQCRTAWDIVEVIPNSQYTTQGGHEKTDDNGYFEMLVESEKDIYFQSKLYALDCTTNITEGIILPGLPPSILWDSFQDLGELTETTEIIEVSGINPNLFRSAINGIFLDCDGSAATGGIVELVNNFTFPSQAGPAIYWPVINDQGYFQRDMYFCEPLDPLWTVATLKLGDFRYSTEVNMTEGGYFDLGTIQACEANNTKYGSISLNVGNLNRIEEYQIFNTKEDANYSSFVGIPRMFIGQAKIIIPNIQIGDNSIQEFRMSDGDDWGFHSINNELTATVESIENGFALGTFSGNHITVEGIAFSLTGEFNLPL